VAFPHGRVPGLNQLLAAFGLCQAGVDFASFDGKPTHFFFVLLIPENSEGSHLKALARLNRVFMDEEFRHRLLKAKDADQAFALLLAQDERS
jgi:PTS system nitrogen regulatory IIA component